VGRGAAAALVSDTPAGSRRKVDPVVATRDHRPPAEPTDWSSAFARRGWAGQREYQLLVEMKGIERRIWRRLVMADTTPLPLLHRILQAAFSWKDYHLHEFRVGTVCFGVPDDEYPPPHIDESSVRLYQLAHEPGDHFLYLYDFGDSWEHDVVLEDMRPAGTPVTPVCLGGERAAPPEDCGGVDGYQQLVEALRDARHPEHADLKRWAGRYDPDAFSLELINRRLARLPRDPNGRAQRARAVR
jgi:hypothetical protein